MPRKGADETGDDLIVGAVTADPRLIRRGCLADHVVARSFSALARAIGHHTAEGAAHEGAGVCGEDLILLFRFGYQKPRLDPYTAIDHRGKACDQMERRKRNTVPIGYGGELRIAALAPLATRRQVPPASTDCLARLNVACRTRREPRRQMGSHQHAPPRRSFTKRKVLRAGRGRTKMGPFGARSTLIGGQSGRLGPSPAALAGPLQQMPRRAHARSRPLFLALRGSLRLCKRRGAGNDR